MQTPYQKIIVFDLETSGLKPEYHAITEVALIAIDAKTLEIVDKYVTAIKPYRSEELYTPDAAKLTGYTYELLQEYGKPSETVLEEIIDFLMTHRNGSVKPILAGHNIVNFDIPFLEQFFKDHKKKLDKFINTLHYIDTLLFARLRYFESPNYELGTICQREDVPLASDDAHGALEDAEANAYVLIEFLKSLRSKENVLEEQESNNIKFF